MAEPPDPSADRTDLSDAVRVGIRRAAVHMIRAGVEVVAGVGAFLDEVARSRRREAQGPEARSGPTRIEVE